MGVRGQRCQRGTTSKRIKPCKGGKHRGICMPRRRTDRRSLVFSQYQGCGLGTGIQ